MTLLTRFGGIALVAIAACSRNDVSADEVPRTSTSIDPKLQPALGDVVTQKDPPPPISGGTLAISRTEPLAVAADPDRDRVYVVDLASLGVRHTIQLSPKSEPGRVALDGAGRAHVALRNTNELATIDLTTGAFFVRPACIAPRGVAYDRFRERIVVACASGDLAVFAPAGGDRKLLPRVGDDLRDVVVRASGLQLTQFRHAALRDVGVDGEPVDTLALPGSTIAWRATSLDPDDAESPAVIVSQDAQGDAVSTEPGGYGSSSVSGKRDALCADSPGIVSARVWIVGDECFFSEDIGGDCHGRTTKIPASVSVPSAVLPVDVATNGHDVALVAPGNAFTPALNQIFVVSGRFDDGAACPPVIRGNVTGQATALAYDSKGRLVVQTREPARLHIMSDDRTSTFKEIVLAMDSRADTGHAVFHANAGGSIACASCHAEGGDDGHVWSFERIGPRRTPSLRGTTSHTEPFHWDGDMKDLPAIVEHVFQERMSGPKLTPPQTAALSAYMNALPPPPQKRRIEEAPPRGKQLFEERCTSCHANAMLTNNQTVDVGTNGKFQVPSLVGVAWRGPWLHDGCATTLLDRFDPACGGDKHADISGLDQAQLADMIAFMETF